jgi:hypothetical protein
MPMIRILFVIALLAGGAGAAQGQSPREIFANSQLDAAHMQMGLGNYQETNRIAGEVLRMEGISQPTRGSALMLMASAYAYLEDYDQALKCLRTVLATPGVTESQKHAATEQISLLEMMQQIRR